MKVYAPLEETSTYRDLYDSYNQTVDNLNDVDFLYKSDLSDGRVFSDTIGYVNLQEGHMGQNITIAAADLGNFKIRGFVYFTRKFNTYKIMDINCDLTQYKDNKPHFLYVLVQTGGTYEVYDSMQENTEDRMLFARFVIDSSGDSIQFYILAPFAGTPDYIKSTEIFEAVDGLKVSGTASGALKLSEGKVRFSGINFDDISDPDLLTIDISSDNIPFRYVTWDSTTQGLTVDWSSQTRTSLVTGKYMDLTDGSLKNIGTGKAAIQKLFFDPLTKTGVMEYGNYAYDSLGDAIKAVSSVLNYPLVDGMNYLIPIAAIANVSGNSDYTDTDKCAIINLTPNEELVFGSGQASQQLALEAVNRAQQAIDTASTVSSNLATHVANVSNPHSVTKNQLGLANVDNKSAATIRDETISYINSNRSLSSYLPLIGGTITGNLSVNGTFLVGGSTTIIGNLTANGSSTLKSTSVTSLTCSGTSSFSGDMTLNNKSFYIRDSNSSIVALISNSGSIRAYGTTRTQGLTVDNQYVVIGHDRLYLGVLPAEAPTGSYGIYYQ